MNAVLDLLRCPDVWPSKGDRLACAACFAIFAAIAWVVCLPHSWNS